ncbi:MAG: alpha/beta hydrolase family protein, partial [Caulobacteraceae bacterium]
SAGAYNVAMLTLDERLLAAVGMNSRRDIRATVGISGPYDFLPLHDDTLKAVFGAEMQRPRTQPVAYVDGKEAPMFLAHGLKDDTVEPANATRLANRIKARGGEVEVRFYSKLNHTLAIGVFSGPLHGVAPVMDDALAFIAAHDTRP